MLHKFAKVALVSAALVCGVANASIVNAPVPVNASITHAGLEWAWASPVPADGSGFGVIVDLSYQGAFGWRLPTALELANAPLAIDFIFSGANVPFGGSDPVSGATFSAANAALTGDAACASPYFNGTYSHCDWQDGNGQPYAPWFGTSGAQGFADSLVVRAVPEAQSLAMVVAGLGVLGLSRFRRARRQG